jgi:hypothetical protein
VTKLHSGQEIPDAADTAADESNPYMSPIQATQKLQIYLLFWFEAVLMEISEDIEIQFLIYLLS